MPDEQAKSVDELMSIRDVEGIDLPDGDTGEGLKFTTNRGDFNAILHRAADTDNGVIWVCGARGGVRRTGPRHLRPHGRKIHRRGHHVAAIGLP